MISSTANRIIHRRSVRIPDLPEGGLQYLLLASSDPYSRREIFSVILVQTDAPGCAESAFLYDVADNRSAAAALLDLFARETVFPACAREFFEEVAGAPERWAVQKRQKSCREGGFLGKIPSVSRWEKALPQRDGTLPHLAHVRARSGGHTVFHRSGDARKSAVFPLALPNRLCLTVGAKSK